MPIRAIKLMEVLVCSFIPSKATTCMTATFSHRDAEASCCSAAPPFLTSGKSFCAHVVYAVFLTMASPSLPLPVLMVDVQPGRRVLGIMSDSKAKSPDRCSHSKGHSLKGALGTG
ncbi:hypothetical protein MHYP_G00156150 [Metynnis hypsauchen]